MINSKGEKEALITRNPYNKICQQEIEMQLMDTHSKPKKTHESSDNRHQYYSLEDNTPHSSAKAEKRKLEQLPQKPFTANIISINGQNFKLVESNPKPQKNTKSKLPTMQRQTYKGQFHAIIAKIFKLFQEHLLSLIALLAIQKTNALQYMLSQSVYLAMLKFFMPLVQANSLSVLNASQLMKFLIQKLQVKATLIQTSKEFLIRTKCKLNTIQILTFIRHKIVSSNSFFLKISQPKRNILIFENFILKQFLIMINPHKSFLLSFLGILFTFSSWSFISSFFLLGFLFSLQSSFLLFHDFFVLFDCFSVHLDGGVAESAVISIPVLSHEGSGSARRTSLSGLGYVSLACVSQKLPSTEYRLQMPNLTRLWICLFFFLVVQTFFFFFFFPPSKSPVRQRLALFSIDSSELR